MVSFIVVRGHFTRLSSPVQLKVAPTDAILQK